MRLAPDTLDALIELAVTLAVLGMAVKLLLLNAWRAWLFLFPGQVQLRPGAPGPLPAALAPWAEGLRALGFVPVGGHVQQFRFQRGIPSHDFAHPDERVFATLYQTARGEPRLYLLTPLAPGGAVLTRPEEAAAPPSRALLEAHRERLRGLTPTGEFTAPGRLAAGRAWFQGPGLRENRRQSLPGLLWTLVALALVAFLFLGNRQPV